MKRNILFIILLIVIVGGSLFMINSKKDNKNILADEKYTKLFNDTLESDGGPAEDYFAELGYLFLENPNHFVEQLSLLDKEERKIISLNVSFNILMNEEDKDENYTSPLYDIKYKTNQQEFNETLDNLIKNYEYMKKDNERETIYNDDPIPSFHVETVQNQINLINKKDDSFVDEEFAALFARFYSVDPFLFAKTLAIFDKIEISKVAKYIAYCNTNMPLEKDEIPDGSEENELKYSLNDLDDNEKDILDFLQSEIIKYEEEK